MTLDKLHSDVVAAFVDFPVPVIAEKHRMTSFSPPCVWVRAYHPRSGRLGNVILSLDGSAVEARKEMDFAFTEEDKR